MIANIIEILVAIFSAIFGVGTIKSFMDTIKKVREDDYHDH